MHDPVRGSQSRSAAEPDDLQVLSGHANAPTSLGDLIRPIYDGLIAACHHVIGFGTRMLPTPAFSVLVEWFENDPFADELLRMKAANGDEFVFGFLCTENLGDRRVWILRSLRRTECRHVEMSMWCCMATKARIA